MRIVLAEADPLWPRLDRPLDARYFIAGPPAMIESLRNDFSQRGIEGSRIHVDAWE